jgi:hypothetical protein
MVFWGKKIWAKANTLTYLHIESTRMTATTVMKIANTCLQKLDVKHKQDIAAELINLDSTIMRESPDLGQAWLTCTPIGSIVLAHILKKQKKSLEEIEFQDVGYSLLCEFGNTAIAVTIQRCQSLKKVTFSNRLSTPLLVAILKHGLKNHPSLNHLRLEKHCEEVYCCGGIAIFAYFSPAQPREACDRRFWIVATNDENHCAWTFTQQNSDIHLFLQL